MDDDVFDSSEESNDDEVIETVETKSKSSRDLLTRRKIEDYFEEKRLREQIDSFGF